MRSFWVYIITTRSLPRFYHQDMNVPMVTVTDVVWEAKDCTLCNPFGHVAVKTESVTI